VCNGFSYGQKIAIALLRFRDHALKKKKVPLRRYTEVSTDASLTELVLEISLVARCLLN
jgi:hypothetical protein